MSFVKIEPFSRIVLAKYKTGYCLINSTIKIKIKSLSYLIQIVSAPFKTKEPVAEHIADIIIINGIDLPPQSCTNV